MLSGLFGWRGDWTGLLTDKILYRRFLEYSPLHDRQEILFLSTWVQNALIVLDVPVFSNNIVKMYDSYLQLNVLVKMLLYDTDENREDDKVGEKEC